MKCSSEMNCGLIYEHPSSHSREIILLSVSPKLESLIGSHAPISLHKWQFLTVNISFREQG